MERSAETDALPPGAWQHTCMAPGDEAACPGCQARAVENDAVEHGGCMASATDSEHLCSIDCVPVYCPFSGDGTCPAGLDFCPSMQQRMCVDDQANPPEGICDVCLVGLSPGQLRCDSHLNDPNFSPASTTDGERP